MLTTELTTADIENSLSVFSDYELWYYGNTFPEHQTAVDAIWESRPVVNVDNIFARDVDKLLQVIKGRGKLKKVLCKRKRSDLFYEVPALIAGNCSELEVLDIPGMNLTEEDLKVLGSCRKLKYLGIESYELNTEYLEQLIANNPHLESIYLQTNISNKCFENLPETIKEIGLLQENVRDLSIFVRYVHIWKLEKLTMGMELTKEFINTLSQQTTLKYINLVVSHVGNSLEELFINNKGLEDVSLYTERKISIDGACLTYLPPTLKCLKLYTNLILDSDDFVRCIRNWKLESLLLFKFNNDDWLMRSIEASPELSELEIDVRLFSISNSYNFEKLSQIKVLRAMTTNDRSQIPLEKMLRSCVNLETFKIDPLLVENEIYSVLAEFPKLNDISLFQYPFGPRYPHYYNLMNELSRSKSLTTVHLYHCFGLERAHLLTLIRGCKTLTSLLIVMCPTMKIDASLLNDIVLIIQQTDRREVLNIEVKHCDDVEQNISTLNIHPMLNLEVYRKWSS